MAKAKLTEKQKEENIRIQKNELFNQAYESTYSSDERVKALTRIARNGWLAEYHEFEMKKKDAEKAAAKQTRKTI